MLETLLNDRFVISYIINAILLLILIIALIEEHFRNDNDRHKPI